MTCQLLQIQSFAPQKIVCEKPEIVMYSISELTNAVINAVKEVIYPEMTEGNKLLYDAPGAIFSKNRNRSIVAARFFIMYFLHADYKWHDRRCAEYFGLNRTMCISARKNIYDQLTSKFDNQYKDIYQLIKSYLIIR